MTDYKIDRWVTLTALIVLFLALILYFESISFYSEAYKLWLTKCNTAITVNWTIP